MSGYVYAVRCGDFVKIGWSRNPRRRAVKINSDNPMPCELLGYYEASRRDEALVQESLDAHRTHAEWFRYEGPVQEFCAGLPPPRSRQRRRPVVAPGRGTPLHFWLSNMGMSSAAFGRAIGASEGAVRKWRTGERIPRWPALARIAEATNGAVTANDFFAQEAAE